MPISNWRSSTPGDGWFLEVGSFKAHLKLVFFDGASHARSPEPTCDQAPASPRRAGRRQARRSATRRLGEASQPNARMGQRLTNVNFRSVKST